MARTLWDWDEAQFALALREYDVASHAPHPPGFPAWVAITKAIHFVVQDEFRALQTAVLIAACALFPLAYWLAREAGFRFRTAYLGALLFVFLPTVWFYGGTALSDIPGTAVILASCALLLRGRTDGRAYVAGAMLLAIGAGMRPQALLFGCVPSLLATFAQWKVSRRRVLATIVTAALLVVALYVGAALASASTDAYLAQLEYVREWVRQHDAWTAPGRPPLGTLVDEFVVKPMRGGRLGFVLAALAGVAIGASLVKKDRGVWILLGTFLPFAVFALFMLDINSYGRYGVAYVALHALLAARGVEALANVFPGGAAAASAADVQDARRPKRPPLHAVIQAAIVLAIAARYAYWTWPAIAEVRRSASPPVAVVQWIQANVPKGSTIWSHLGMRPYVQWGLTEYDLRWVSEFSEIPADTPLTGVWYVSEGLSNEVTAIERTRKRDRVWDIARRRYFEACTVPLGKVWRFRDGWYGEELEGDHVTRWMRTYSNTLVPADGRVSRISLRVISPAEIRPTQIVRVRWNGVEVGRFASPGKVVEWKADVPTRNGANLLEIEASGSIHGVPGDDREFGVRLLDYGLRNVESAMQRTTPRAGAAAGPRSSPAETSAAPSPRSTARP